MELFKNDKIIYWENAEKGRFSAGSPTPRSQQSENISSDLLKNWGINDSSRKLFFESITFSFYKNLFIPFIKRMSFEDARDYVIKLTQFYSAGITTMR